MPAQNYERAASDNSEEKLIQSHSFGGLNTTASPLNVPYEDSPFLLNTITDISGNVLKRPGTRVVYREATPSDGVALTPFATGLNYNFLVVKRNKSLDVFEVVDDVATRVVSKANVFTDAAALVRPSIVSSSELEPRVMFFTGVNKPVQLKFIEQQQIQTASSTSVVFANAGRFLNATPTNVVFFVNRQRVVPTSVSFSATSLTVVSPQVINANDVCDIILITWQWWAEGISWQGNRFYGSVTRYNVVPTDQNIAIPEKLRSDLDPEDSSKGLWDVYAYRRATRTAGSSYLRKASHDPLTEDEYSHGDGSRHIPNGGATTYTTPTPFFLTFGATQTAYTGMTPTPQANSPTTVYLIRYRQLKANGERGVLSDNVQVFVDGVKRDQILAAGDTADNTYRSYWLYDKNAAVANSTNKGTQLCYQIGFNAIRLGLPGTSFVEWANIERTHIGSAALAQRFDYNDGTYEIAYGLGTFADYGAGYYPSTATLYQGRLVLSGFAHRPLTTVFSSLNDSTVPGKFYMDFHITDDDASRDTRPFDVSVNGRPDDRCISMVEWQASLFLLTRKAVYRLHGGDNPLSPSSRYVNFISATGCVNASCVAQTDANVVYLSDSGLYDLTPTVENGEYQVRERSIKVRDKFGLTDDPVYEELPWVKYDSEQRYVMVGYPAPGQFISNRYIYVYNTYRDSWTEFNTPGGFNTFHASQYVDRLRGSRFLAACTTSITSTTSNDFMLLRFNDSRYLDYRQKETWTGTAKPLLFMCEVQHTISKSQQHYGVNYSQNWKSTAFTQHPVREVSDISVLVKQPGQSNFVVLQKGLDWEKEASGFVYLMRDYPDGSTLAIRCNAPFDKARAGGFGQWAVYVDNVNITPNITQSGASYSFTPPNATLNQVVEWGQLYLSVYTTPLFVSGSLGNLKRMRHVYAYFDNKNLQPLYTAGDVNTASGQSQYALVDTYKTEAQCQITMLYSSELSGETSADIYGSDQLYWDESQMDLAQPGAQGKLFQLFKEPIQGVGYSFQLVVWNYDPHTFKLCGFQLDTKLKGKRYIR